MNFEENKIKWLWLSNFSAVTKSKVIKLIKEFGTIDNIFLAERKDYERLSFLKIEDIENLSDKNLDKARLYYEKLKKENIEILCYGEPLFPSALLLISNHPCVIYAKGIIKDLNKIPCFSIVGARASDEYGKKSALSIAKAVSENGICVVSGMADGIDSYAHMGAISGNGYTVGVLGCGVDICYPKENMNLYEKILKNGMIISEYPPKTPPERFRFPERNKIIAALSLATLVIQAREKSGSLITAEQTLKFGRKLFALPGNFSSSLSKGTNILISKGASCVTEINDILNFYGVCEKDKEDLSEEKIFSSLSEEEKLIYDALFQKPLLIDEISKVSKIPVFKLYGILLSMELGGIIVKDATEHYSIN
ncbi:MAG: DNA-processing protein DprA [Clostridia bacterium]|nr:DNA-processing protein DprA [Clostridia bacterium]